MEQPEAPRRGRFIVLEGLDGAGTTTQAHELARRLGDAGIGVELTHEPTNGPVGAVLRQAIEGRLRLDERSMALLFAADRADHLFNPHNGIVGLLEQGRWVVCDRYLLSSLAYQGAGDADRAWILELNRYAIAPDLTVFLDTDPDRCIARIAARSVTAELFHAEDRLLAVLRNYREAIGDEAVPGELAVVDGNGPIDGVAEAIWAQVRPHVRDAAPIRDPDRGPARR